MKELCVGFAIMWLLSFFGKKKISVSGFGSILLMLAICYGLGLLFLKLVHHDGGSCGGSDQSANTYLS